MNHETDGRNRAETVRLYPGIHISFYSLTAETESFPIDDGHSEQILEINYCRAGRIGWIRKNGSSVYLGPKDFRFIRCRRTPIPAGRCQTAFTTA